MAKYEIADALQVEYQAIYAFGVAGAMLSGGLLDAALVAESRHREQRDAVVAHLRDTKATVPGAKPAYVLPFEVTGSAEAVKLITEIEDEVTMAWRAAVANTFGDARRVAVTAYTQNAVNAARWRRAQGESPSTVAYPGRP